MQRTFQVLFEEGEDGWFVASVPTLPGCHTQGKGLEQARERIQEAIRAYLSVTPNMPIQTRYVGIDSVSVSV
ncbi:MAG: type II toxin-antitoxin system HicB family antitoxin [Candidatus Thermoplasmatota archaeon]